MDPRAPGPRPSWARSFGPVCPEAAWPWPPSRHWFPDPGWSGPGHTCAKEGAHRDGCSWAGALGSVSVPSMGLRPSESCVPGAGPRTTTHPGDVPGGRVRVGPALALVGEQRSGTPRRPCSQLESRTAAGRGQAALQREERKQQGPPTEEPPTGTSPTPQQAAPRLPDSIGPTRLFLKDESPFSPSPLRTACPAHQLAGPAPAGQRRALSPPQSWFWLVGSSLPWNAGSGPAPAISPALGF